MLIVGLSSGQKVGIAVVAACFIVFALASAMLVPRLRSDFPGKGLRLFVVVAIGITVGMLATVVVLAREPKEEREAVAATATAATTTETAPVETAPAETAPAETGTPTGDPVAGKAVFAKAGCVGCHTLAEAGATGAVGPNLDDAKPDASLVVDRVTNGRGAMPSFKGQLSEQDIQDVAAFVSSATQGG